MYILPLVVLVMRYTKPTMSSGIVVISFPWYVQCMMVFKAKKIDLEIKLI